MRPVIIGNISNTARSVVGLSALVFLTACILSETRHTLYLEPNGAAEWVVLQTDVRGSGADPEKRSAEEERYLDAARRAEHPAARGLDELGGSRVRTRILREDRPYTIETTASFPAVDALFRDFFRALDVDTDVRLERVAGGRRLTIRLSGIERDGTVEIEDEDDPVLELIDSDINVVLTAGEFREVQGFVTTDHADMVVLAWEALEDQVTDEGTLTLSLTWGVD